MSELPARRRSCFACRWQFPIRNRRKEKRAVAELTKVAINARNFATRYTARVIHGVKVKPSPKWLIDRLATLGIAAINNVVDITNYVLMECGQPLHAFDFRKLEGREIMVREARQGGAVRSDQSQNVRIGTGHVRDCRSGAGSRVGRRDGGRDTEVTAGTIDVLIEAAEFDPLSIRNTARKLSLHSDSSYRFERGLDPEGVDWASRRCCELILQEAGGELASGVIDVGRQPPRREPIVLRLSQLKRILGH